MVEFKLYIMTNIYGLNKHIARKQNDKWGEWFERCQMLNIDFLISLFAWSLTLILNLTMKYKYTKQKYLLPFVSRIHFFFQCRMIINLRFFLSKSKLCTRKTMGRWYRKFKEFLLSLSRIKELYSFQLLAEIATRHFFLSLFTHYSRNKNKNQKSHKKNNFSGSTVSVYVF